MKDDKQILILDDDEKFYEELLADPLLKNLNVVVVDSAAKASNYIQEHANNFYAVFLSPLAGLSHWLGSLSSSACC